MLARSVLTTPPLSQVRIDNTFLFSNWSEALVLPREEDFIDNCTLLVPLTPTPPTTADSRTPAPTTPSSTLRAVGSSIDVPFWAYIIIGVGGLLLLLLLFGIPLAILLHRNRQQKKHWKEVLEVLYGSHSIGGVLFRKGRALRCG